MRFLRGLLMVVGAVAIAVAIAAGVSLYSGSRTGFAASAEPSAAEAWIARSMRVAAIPRQAKEKKMPEAVTPRLVAAGRDHFEDDCAGCHAKDGSGETEIGRALYPRPPDLRKQETQALTDGELYFIIENGIRLSGMPASGESPRHEREEGGPWALVAFIRELPKRR